MQVKYFKKFREQKEITKRAPLMSEQSIEIRKLKQIFSLISKDQKVQVIACPSISFKKEEIKDIVGIDNYEMRSLWQILYAAKENIHVLYLSSNPVETENVRHLLDGLNVDSQVRERIAFYDLGSLDVEGCLTEKILQVPKVLKELKDKVNELPSFIMPFTYSLNEQKLADVLEVPVFGCHPDLQYWQTKSGNKRIFQKAGVAAADGQEDIKSKEELVFGILNLWRRNPDVQKFVVKLDTGVSGEGNAILELEKSFEEFNQLNIAEKILFIEKSLEKLKFQNKNLNLTEFMTRLSDGGIVEVFFEGENFFSPSAQGYISPFGDIKVLSTHDQLLDESGMKYLGCRFPAEKSIRAEITIITERIAQELAKLEIIGFFSVDFIVFDKDGIKQIKVIEINVRQGGTTHPYQTAKLMTNSFFNKELGVLENKAGQHFFYQANDNCFHDNYKKISPKRLISSLKAEELLFCSKQKKGVVLHMLNSMQEFGKFGYTIIANSEVEVDNLRNSVEESLMTLIKNA